MATGAKVKLDEAQQEKANGVIKRDGIARTARAWGMNDVALLRAVAGYNIQRGTRALIEQGLQKEGQ